jgi:acetyltransferase-like isoleucine patch superfamily enzyme
MGFDRSYFANPVLEYFRWLAGKIYYQHKYRGKNLRISYKSFIKSCTFGKFNWIGVGNTLMNSHIGDYTYIAGNCAILDTTIGKYCSIGTGVKIAVGTHPTSVIVSTHPSVYCRPDFHSISYVDEDKFTYKKGATIGNDVWIGANAVLVNGVTVADGAVIAANSVVNKHVGPYEIVGGVPAKLIRKRFTDEQIEVLEKVKWWDKPEDWIKKNISSFWNIREFVENFKDEPEII